MWAQAGRDLPAYGTTHADAFYGKVPCTRQLTKEEVREAYEVHTGNVIVETFKERKLDPNEVLEYCLWTWTVHMGGFTYESSRKQFDLR